jgi:predicted protein tyrosine phosphatase
MSLRFQRTQQILLLLVVAAVLVSAATYRNHQRYKHWAVHDPGMVYRSAWLEPDILDEMIETHQIRSVVNLCRPGEMGEQRWIDQRRATADAGAKLIELSMPLTVDAGDPAIAEHIAVLADPDNYPMLVHCQHGVTRTAKMLAIYDILFRSMDGRQSLTAQPLFGRDDHNVHVQAFVRNFEQRWQRLYPHVSPDQLQVLTEQRDAPRTAVSGH